MGQGQMREIEISGLWTFVLPFSVRHQFVNEAYDNVEGMGTTQNGTSPEYAQPVIANQARFPIQPLPGQDNGAFFLGKTLLLSQLVALRCLFVRLLTIKKSKKTKESNDKENVTVRKCKYFAIILAYVQCEPKSESLYRYSKCGGKWTTPFAAG